MSPPGGAPAGAPGQQAVVPGAGGGRRPLGIVALVVLGLAVLALLVNAALAGTAERRAAEAFEEHFGVPAQVELRGFPVGLRTLTGRVPEAMLRATDVPLEDAGGATMSTLALDLHDVHLNRDSGRLEADRADVRVTMDDDAVQDLLGVLGRVALTDIELRPGTVRVRMGGLVVADVNVRVEAGALVFGLAAPLDQLISTELRVDDFPLGFAPDDVVVADAELRLTGTATPFVLDG